MRNGHRILVARESPMEGSSNLTTMTWWNVFGNFQGLLKFEHSFGEFFMEHYQIKKILENGGYQFMRHVVDEA